MTPEEQEYFNTWVQSRRDKYSWTQFFLIMTPVVVIALIFLYAVWTAIWD